MKKQDLRKLIKYSVRSILKENFLAEKKDDPTREGMLHFLQSQFGREDGFEDSAEVAMYWFANHYHGGQWSNLYAMLSTSPFRPGPISNGPEPDSMEDMMYQALAAEFGGKKTGDGEAMEEMTTTGAVQGYMTPKAFSKKGVKETTNNSDFINGQSNQVAASRVNKLLAALTKGIFKDQSWEAINKIFSKLQEAGIEFTILKTNYGGQQDSQNSMPTFKEWHISIPFTNNKGKQMELVGQITAHGAGSVENPLDRYDITAYVTAIPKRDLQELEQPELVHPETGEVARGPRQRPEDWQQGGDRRGDQSGGNGEFLSKENAEGYVLDWIIEKLRVETDPKKREALQIVQGML